MWTPIKIDTTATGLGGAIGRKGPVLLFLFAIGCFAFDRFAIRPRMEMMSLHGRRQIGQVVAATPEYVDPDRMRFTKPVSTIEVHDPELGAQLIEQFGRRPVGERLPVLCATPLRRCEIEADVREQLGRYPVTVLNVIGVTTLALAAGWLWAPRQRWNEVLETRCWKRGAGNEVPPT